MIKETSPILNLMLAKGVGSKTLSDVVETLLSRNLSLDNLSIDALADEFGLNPELKRNALAVQDKADELALQLDRENIHILVRGINPYPRRLVSALGVDAPAVLFVRGNLSIFEAKAIGFCGSRHASEKGVQVAGESAAMLGTRGLNVVSGYAKGVDLAAHCAALQAGGTTSIVLAEGILHFRPKREIKSLISDGNHLVISEFHPKIPWNARNAMQRNKTIIGLSDAMVVIESGMTGGTHACASSALGLGRPLFVADYAAPAESAAGNKYFLSHGAVPLRGDRQGRPNLGRLYEVLGVEDSGNREGGNGIVVASEQDQVPPEDQAAPTERGQVAFFQDHPRAATGCTTPVTMPDPAYHECDLFLLASHSSYVADRILPEFARRGCRNLHGWGLGYYTGGQARVVRRASPAAERNDLSSEFAAAVEIASSPVIIGHLRLASRGEKRVENNHPFRLDFLGYQWLLVHNGTAPRHAELIPPEERLLTESDNDTPRVFEFLRREIINYCEDQPTHSLIEACRRAFGKLLAADPQGKLNIILSNGHLTFVFIHWRDFYLLHRPKQTGDVALISTIPNLTDHEEWLKVRKRDAKEAKMLVFGGPSLVFNGDIPA